MTSPMQSLGDSPMSLPIPGSERESYSSAAVRAAGSAGAITNINNNNNSKMVQQPQQQMQAGTSGSSAATYCQRRNKSALGKHRHEPYDRSPGGGSTCSTSSDESCNEDTETENPGKTDQHARKRTAANERERKRMHTVNSAFDQLRELVPTYPSSRKLSKIDTLKLACTYIQDLKTLLINSHIMPHGEDVVYHPDGYATTSPSPVYHVKSEAQYAAAPSQPEYPASACTYPPFNRVQQSYISDPDFSASEPENHSPPYYTPASSQASAAVIAVRPVPLSRTSSDSAVVHMQSTQQVSISMSSQQLPQSVPPYPRHAPSSCPSLATVQHTSIPPPAAPTVTSPVQGPASLPWRSGSVPYPCVYSQ